MVNWEITAGKEVSWKEHKNWWVMTWIINGVTKQSAFTPIPVMAMDIDILLVPYAPAHGVQFGDQTKIAGPAGGRMYHILPSNVWARMPLEVPKPPNVGMFFDRAPF